MPDTYADDFIMLPKVDFAFKELMTNEKVRKGFLSAVLNTKVTDIKETILLNTNLKVAHEDEKLSILDVRILMNNNSEIDIEIQLAYYGTWSLRTTFYLAKMLAGQTNINKTYSNIKKCIGINILDFKYTRDDRFYKSYHLREDKSSEIFTDILELHLVELPKLPEQSDGSSLYNWAKFIKAEKREEFEMIAKEDEYIGEAFKHLEVISQDHAKRIAYTSRQKAIMDHNTIMAERYEMGRIEGERKGRIEGERKGRIEGERKGRIEGERKGRLEGLQEGERKGRLEGLQEGERKGRQELLNQLIQLGLEIPNDILESSKLS